jgi:hypothetical protein
MPSSSAGLRIPSTPSIEDVGIHHRGAYIPVSEQLLNCPDVVAVFEQVRGEGMALLVKVAAGGAGGRAPDLRLPEPVGDEVDDALLGWEGSGDAEERGGLGEDGVLSWRTGM